MDSHNSVIRKKNTLFSVDAEIQSRVDEIKLRRQLISIMRERILHNEEVIKILEEGISEG